MAPRRCRTAVTPPLSRLSGSTASGIRGRIHTDILNIANLIHNVKHTHTQSTSLVQSCGEVVPPNIEHNPATWQCARDKQILLKPCLHLRLPSSLLTFTTLQSPILAPFPFGVGGGGAASYFLKTINQNTSYSQEKELGNGLKRPAAVCLALKHSGIRLVAIKEV